MSLSLHARHVCTQISAGMSDCYTEHVCAWGLLSLWLALLVHVDVSTSPESGLEHLSGPWKGEGRTYIAQVQDEAVAIVEALPGHRHLGGADCTPPFDLEESLHHHLIGYHVLESRCHASFLLGQGDSVSPRESVWGRDRDELKEILAYAPLDF